MLNSTRRSISYPNPDYSDRPDLPLHFLNLVNALELDMIYAQGTSANRLARPHLVGTFFYETDTTVSYYDDGTTWRKVDAGGPGTELDYAQVTSNGSGITATTEGTAVNLVVGNSVTYDGGKVKIEGYFPAMVPTAGLQATFVFLRDTTVVGQATAYLGVSGKKYSNKIETFDTPSAAAHTYKIAAFVDTSTLTLNAGAGGTGALVPAWLRVIRTA